MPWFEQGAGRRKQPKLRRPVSVFRDRTTTELCESRGKLGLVAAEDRDQISILECLSSHDCSEANCRCSNVASVICDHGDELANFVDHLGCYVLR